MEIIKRLLIKFNTIIIQQLVYLNIQVYKFFNIWIIKKIPRIDPKFHI